VVSTNNEIPIESQRNLGQRHTNCRLDRGSTMPCLNALSATSTRHANLTRDGVSSSPPEIVDLGRSAIPNEQPARRPLVDPHTAHPARKHRRLNGSVNL
jgi:hypothetical protein